jgi:hypothetical protein
MNQINTVRNETHLDPDLHLWTPEPTEQDIKAQRAGQRLLKAYGAENWGQFYRSIYRDTNCGASVGVLFHGADKPVYCDRLYGYGKDSWPLQIYISSIVEGVEQTTDTYIVNLCEPNAGKQLSKAIASVEEEADAIWVEAYGSE